MEKKAPKKPQGWLVLFLVSLVAALALAGTNELTKDAIEQRNLEGASAARKAVMADADSFEQLQVQEGSAVDNGYRGLAGGQTLGYVAQSTVQGYAGPIEVVVGMDLNGTLTGISVGGTNFSETAGLGSKAKEPGFTDQFKGLALPAKLRDNVDAIAGATITSNAVVLGVNQAGTYMASVAGISVEDKTPSQVKVEGNTVTVTKDGFGGPIDITITVDDNGVITSMAVGGDQFAETPGYGAKAKEAAFTDQFIGKSGKLTLNEDVDSVSGATITSSAVVNGVNEALAALRGEAVTTPEPAPEPTPAPEGRTAKATKEGFEGPIEAVIIVDNEGKIVGITIGENASFNETPGFGTKVKESAFTDQFIGKTGPFELGNNIDAVSGATWSSKGAVDAVNAALESMKDEPSAQTSTEVKPAAAEGKSATVTVEGFAGEIDVTVTVDDSGAIAALIIGGDQFAETPGFGAKAKEEGFTSQFIGKKGTIALGTDVDAIAGATVTSEAVIKGVNEALNQLSEKPAPMDTPVLESSTAITTPEPTDTPDAESSATTATGQASAGELVSEPSIDGNTATVSVNGFAGMIEVQVTVDENGVITALTVGGAQFAETPGFGAKAKDEAFTGQFIGKSGKVVLGTDVDAITGATITSEAVVKGVNEALASLAAGAARQATALVDGFADKIEVTVTVDENGVITALTVGGAQFAETEGFGAKAKDEAFTGQFIGKAGKVVLGTDVDAITGATITSEAVVKGVNEALASLTAVAARQATAIADGFADKIEVTVTVDENGVITALTVGGAQFAETEGFGAKAKDEAFTGQFIGKAGKVVLGTDVDAITGATVTSEAVVEAVNAALETLAK